MHVLDENVGTRAVSETHLGAGFDAGASVEGLEGRAVNNVGRVGVDDVRTPALRLTSVEKNKQ
jgi:hypothetical protein